MIYNLNFISFFSLFSFFYISPCSSFHRQAARAVSSRGPQGSPGRGSGGAYTEPRWGAGYGAGGPGRPPGSPQSAGTHVGDIRGAAVVTYEQPAWGQSAQIWGGVPR